MNEVERMSPAGGRSGMEFILTRSEGPFLFPQKKKQSLPRQAGPLGFNSARPGNTRGNHLLREDGFPVKAVILAGGEGLRLRPISAGLPKPMVPFLDRPVLEHVIGLLKRHGITDLALTLQAMPQTVASWLGDGAELGVKLTYFVEREPLGTAGSVKRCMSWLGEEDFLVISGDIITDIDLTEAAGFHRASRAAATLVLCRHSSPLEYGQVLTGDDGKVRSFVEKPAWSQVLTDTVNTGIYFLTAKAMEGVPEGTAYDFSRDLFPRLLEQGAPLYGHIASGSWWDIGDCGAYLDCAAQVLSGRSGIDLGLPLRAPGIWAAEEPPADVTLVPPCWIGPGVTLGAGSLLGPHAILSRGSSVGRRSLVQRSVLMEEARVGDRCTLYGAVLCRGASAGRGAVLNEGAVLGAESAAGENSILMERVKVWPGLRVRDEARLTTSLVAGGASGMVSFGDGGVIRGTLEEGISPALLLAIGGSLGAGGRVGLGASGTPCARMLARCAAGGAAAAGAEVLLHDGTCPAAGAWAAERYALPVSLFVEQEGERLFLHFFDSRGLPLSRARQRRLEGALLRGEVHRAAAERVGTWEHLSGIPAAHAADAARRARYGRGPLTPVAVSVPGTSPADRLLASTLEDLGCVVLGKRSAGVPGFAAEYGGLRLSAWDEEGRALPPEQMLALVSLIELENGGGRVALPAGSPVAIQALAGQQEGAVLTLDRDGPEAEALYAGLPALRDAAFAAARVCARLGRTGERLATLAARVPRFVVLRREVPLRRGRGAVMHDLAQRLGGEAGQGVRVSGEEGVVWLSPLSRRSALRVSVEAASMEAAEELCARYAEEVRRTDQRE